MTSLIPEPDDLEARRLRALLSYRILDTPPEPAFNDLAVLAARVCDAPMALVSLIDRDRQWFKAKVGIDTAETPRKASFCTHIPQGPDHIMEKEALLKEVHHRVKNNLQVIASLLRLELEPAHLEIEQAIPCGLIANELASNSLKHGFPDGQTGEVRIRLRSEDDGRQLRLTVSDSGIGLPPDFDPGHKRSLGLQLVSDLARQLQGQLHIGLGPGAVFDVNFLKNRTRTGDIQRATPVAKPTTEAE